MGGGLALLTAAAAALVFVPVALRLGRATGAVDDPSGDPLKIHAAPVPVLGGLGVVAACVVALVLAPERPSTAVIAAVLLALGAGLYDDLRSLPPGRQALLQTTAGLVLGASMFHHGALASIAAVVLVLACSNGVNWIDGQDGLAGGLGAIACLGLAALATGGERTLGLVFAGALAVFLLWNRPPARIFLGNGGSYAVGTALAATAAAVVERHGWRGALAAGLCLGVFAFELLFTVARRLPSHAIAKGDRGHSYDLAAVRRGARGPVTVRFLAIGAVAAALGVAVASMPVTLAVVVTATAAACGAVAALGLWSRARASGRKRELARGLT